MTNHRAKVRVAMTFRCVALAAMVISLVAAGGQPVAEMPTIGLPQRILVQEADASDSNTMVQLFGCVMPLPPGYVLRADAEPFFFYSRGADTFGRISIRPYQEPDPSKIKVLRETRIGDITVVQVEGLFIRSRPRFSYIHDGETQLAISGDDEDWALRMARHCAENPEPS